LAKKDTEVAKREEALRLQEEELSKKSDAIDEVVSEKLRLERAKIAAEEGKKARQVLAVDFEQKEKEIAGLQETLAQRETKLAEAQKAQAEFLKKQRELEDARRELDLTIETRIREGLDVVRDQARKEAEEGLKLKVQEKEQTITSMQKQIEDLKRRAEQGSQQLQGEVVELELETLLRTRFPQDSIEPVPKGEHGGDVLQRVVGPVVWRAARSFGSRSEPRTGVTGGSRSSVTTSAQQRQRWRSSSARLFPRTSKSSSSLTAFGLRICGPSCPWLWLSDIR